MAEITLIPVSQVKAGANDRKDFDPARLAELAESIRAHGLAQPITVRPLRGLIPVFEIVAGERRFRAISQVLQWDTVPAIVRELDDEAASAIMLAENTSRADLNPVEEARAYQSRIDRFGWTAERIAEVAGVSQHLVESRLLLLTLNEEILHLIAHGHLPLGHAELLAKLDANRQRIALRIYRESNAMPLNTFRPIVYQLLEEQSQDSLFDLEAFWVDQVQQGKDLPRSGKRAVTGAPTRRDLPTVSHSSKDGVGDILDRYIAALLKQGLEAEAATLGTVYDALVKGNFMRVPLCAELLTE